MKKLEKILLGLVILALVFVVMSCGKVSKIEMIEVPAEKSFYISKETISSDLYIKVMNIDSDEYNPEIEGRNVNLYSWSDAIIFCNKLSEFMGYMPCYSVNGSYDVEDWKVIRDVSSDTIKGIEGTIGVLVNSNGFRLPSPKELSIVSDAYFYDGLKIKIGNKDSEIGYEDIWCADGNVFLYKNSDNVAIWSSSDEGIYTKGYRFRRQDPYTSSELRLVRYPSK